MVTTSRLRFAAIGALTSTTLTLALLLPEAPARPDAADDAAKQALRFKDNGGSVESAAAIERGLEWLALHQAPDGFWSMSEFPKYGRAKLDGKPIGNCGCKPAAGGAGNDIAGTAFGVLPFLGAGYTHKPSKDPKRKDYTKTVGDGLKYLMKKQNKEGNFGGDSMYSQALATLAVCEAYALTNDAAMKDSAQRAIDFIVDAQHKGGGWRYKPQTSGDMSVSGWQVAALKSGQRAGLTVPKKTFDKAEGFWEECEIHAKTDNPRKEGKLLGYSYLPYAQPGPRIGTPLPTMTAEGLLGRLYFGVKPDNRDVRDALETVKAYPPSKLSGCFQEYHVTQLMWKLGGDDWKWWNLGPDGKDGLRDLLVKRQDDGQLRKLEHQLGSWDGENSFGGGRLMATSMSLLSLEAPYEQLPMYRREKGK